MTIRTSVDVKRLNRSWKRFEDGVAAAPAGVHERARAIAAFIGDTAREVMCGVRELGLKADACDRIREVEAVLFGYIKDSNPGEDLFGMLDPESAQPHCASDSASALEALRAFAEHTCASQHGGGPFELDGQTCVVAGGIILIAKDQPCEQACPGETQRRQVRNGLALQVPEDVKWVPVQSIAWPSSSCRHCNGAGRELERIQCQDCSGYRFIVDDKAERPCESYDDLGNAINPRYTPGALCGVCYGTTQSSVITSFQIGRKTASSLCVRLLQHHVPGAQLGVVEVQDGVVPIRFPGGVGFLQLNDASAGGLNLTNKRDPEWMFSANRYLQPRQRDNIEYRLAIYEAGVVLIYAALDTLPSDLKAMMGTGGDGLCGTVEGTAFKDEVLIHPDQVHWEMLLCLAGRVAEQGELGWASLRAQGAMTNWLRIARSYLAHLEEGRVFYSQPESSWERERNEELFRELMDEQKALLARFFAINRRWLRALAAALVERREMDVDALAQFLLPVTLPVGFPVPPQDGEKLSMN